MEKQVRRTSSFKCFERKLYLIKLDKHETVVTRKGTD